MHGTIIRFFLYIIIIIIILLIIRVIKVNFEIYEWCRTQTGGRGCCSVVPMRPLYLDKREQARVNAMTS
jgi:hypothetical protein